jgi:hypothetical protein
MLIYRGDVPGIDGLCEILGTMAQQFDRRMLLARWNDGEMMSYMITMDDDLVVRGPAFQPLVLAFPDGAYLAVQKAEPGR